MRLNPYKRHCLTIACMGGNIYLTGICSFSKYSKATGTLIPLNPGFFIRVKSVLSRSFLLKTFLFHVCSKHEALTAFSRLLARSNANKRAIVIFGLLFAATGYIAIHIVNIKVLNKKVAECFTMSLLLIGCLNVYKYVSGLFIEFTYFIQSKPAGNCILI